MATNVDFDISSYSIEELINIIGIGGELPLTNEKIVKKIQAMKDQFEEKYEDDEYIIKVNNILDLKDAAWKYELSDTHPIFSIYFNPYYKVDTSVSLNKQMFQIEKKKIVTDWNKWSTSENSIQVKNILDNLLSENAVFAKYDNINVANLSLNKLFKNILDNLLSENAVFAEYIDDNIDIVSISRKYKEALNIAEDARDNYIFFFDEIAKELREHTKEEYSTDYYKDEEENEKSLLEGDFMDDNEKILATNNFAMPIWNRTTFKGTPPTMPKDYKNPLLKTMIDKTINIDSQYRTIADPVVCIRCPDTLEYYEGGGGTSVSDKLPVVASNSDGRLLIAGNSGTNLYKLDIDLSANFIDDLIPAWFDISFNNNILETNINKEWKDITMNYGGDYIAVCNENYIWYSTQSGNANTWNKSHISYLTNNDLSNSDISGNWNAITSDFTGKKLFVSRTVLEVADRVSDFKKGGICYSDDYASTWIDISNGQIILPGINDHPVDNKMNQYWIDIEITGDGEKVYGIFKETVGDTKYYIAKSINNGITWEIINNYKFDHTTNTELIDYEWKQIVTNFYGTKVFIIADNHDYIWRSFDSGTNWSKVTEITGAWNSITCSLDGLKVAVWDTNTNKLRFSENGGATWNDPAEVTGEQIKNSNIVISDDGDRILGLDYDGNIFTSKKCVEKDLSLFDRPSNFTINLSEPIKNVVSIAIKNIELPHTWNVFSESEGTNVFYVKKTGENIITIKIPEGTYHYNDTFGADLNLIKTLNLVSIAELDDGSLTEVQCWYCEIIDDTELILTGYYGRHLIVGETIEISDFSESANLNQEYTVAAMNSRNEYVLTGTDLPLDKISIGELAITKIEVNSDVATVTLLNEHSFKVGDSVLIRNTHFNGKRTVLSPVTPFTFKFSTQGTANATHIYISDAFAKRLLFDPIVKVKKHELIFSYRGSHDIIVRNYSHGSMTIFWHREESNDVCGPAGQGTRVNYNLGWLLGFRKTLLGLGSRSGKVGKAKLDLKGNKYVYISLDEFSNNKAPDSLIVYENNAATFNMPSYFVKTTMQKEAFNKKLDDTNKCYVKPDSPGGICGKKRRNPDSIDNLTAAQRYTIENIRNTLSIPKKKQYKSPIIPNHLTTLQLKYNGTISPATQNTIDRRVEASQEKREYFGPITLRKFKIRLLNERGNEIDMNENNWSFSLIVKQLYNNN
jgi:hypothetical protein